VTNLFCFDEIARKVQSASDRWSDLPYEQWDVDEATLTAPSRRLVEQVRTLYRRNDLAGALPLGVMESMALPFESYKLAFTPSLITEVYGGRVTETMLEDEGRYVHSEGEATWWIPAGRVFYSPNIDDTPDNELAYARHHFFLPSRFCDPFEQTTTITYDPYDLLMQQARDPLNNLMTVGERMITACFIPGC
jgi:hypothetical protein